MVLESSKSVLECGVSPCRPEMQAWWGEECVLVEISTTV